MRVYGYGMCSFDGGRGTSRGQSRGRTPAVAGGALEGGLGDVGEEEEVGDVILDHPKCWVPRIILDRDLFQQRYVGGVGVVVCTPTKCWHFLLLVLGLWCYSGPWFCLSLILLLFEVSD
jgi:hypothetical protein